MYENYILTENNCRSIWENGHKTGYMVNITINYYRGLPLSCVDEISLVVDGEEVDPKSMVINYRGREFPYLDILQDDFPTDFYWRLGDMLCVKIMKPGGIEQGIHKVKLTLCTRRSYTPTMVAVCEKDLTFA